jgi:hypothetical protein
MTLRERLASLNPQRTITLNGATRPAIVVAENELVIPVDPMPDAYYIEWGAAQAVQQHSRRPVFAMDCVISYHTLGTVQSGVDRGRTLAALDTELIGILQPARTAKRDFTQAPSGDLGTNIWWTMPLLGEVTGGDAGCNTELAPRLERRASTKVFFFPEVDSL